MNLITIVVGGAAALAVMGAPVQQEEAAGFARKAFGVAMRPTHTLPAVEQFLGEFTAEHAGRTEMFSSRRVTPKQIRDQLGDPTSISRVSGEHWYYRLDDGALLKVSMYGPRGPIHQITVIDPETKESKRWLYFAGC